MKNRKIEYSVCWPERWDRIGQLRECFSTFPTTDWRLWSVWCWQNAPCSVCRDTACHGRVAIRKNDAGMLSGHDTCDFRIFHSCSTNWDHAIYTTNTESAFKHKIDINDKYQGRTKKERIVRSVPFRPNRVASSLDCRRYRRHRCRPNRYPT